MFNGMLPPYSGLDAKNSYLIPDFPFSRTLYFPCSNAYMENDILYCRPKFSDFYTLSKTKLLKNPTLHSGTYLNTLYMGEPPPAPGLAPVGLFKFSQVGYHWGKNVIADNLLNGNNNKPSITSRQ